MTGLKKVGVFIQEKVWLEPHLFLYKYSNFSQSSHTSYLPAYEDGTVSRNVGIYNSNAGELPRRKNTTFRTRRKYEIKNVVTSLPPGMSVSPVRFSRILSSAV